MNDNSVEQIISELSKIESLSDNIMNGAERQRDEYAQEMENNFLAYDSTLEKEIDEKLSVLEENLHKENDKEILSMQEQTDKRIGEMEKQFDKVYEQLAKDIVDRMIKE